MFGLYVLHQEESETISLSGQRRRKASLRPALPPVQTAAPSLSSPAFNFVAFANTVLGPISHIPAAKSSQPPGGMAGSEPEARGDQGEEKADPSHLLEKQQAKGGEQRRCNQDRQSEESLSEIEGARPGCWDQAVKQPIFITLIPQFTSLTPPHSSVTADKSLLVSPRRLGHLVNVPMKLLLTIGLPSGIDWQLHEYRRHHPQTPPNIWLETRDNGGKRRGGGGDREIGRERGEKGSHLVSHIRAGRCSPPKCCHPLPRTCAYVALPGQKSLQM